MRDGVVDDIRAAGGEIYAITSEPQRLASKAQEAWGLNFESIGDPHHEISGACSDRGMLDLYVNEKVDLIVSDPSRGYSHPKGYFQPGVLALDSGGRILYRWRGRPTRKNVGGARERPTARYVFDATSKALASSASSGDLADAALDTNPELDARGIPWPLFISLLVANGWFIRPKTFGYIRGGPSAEQRGRRALLRIPFFIAAWVIALTQLPVLWVGIAFAGWVAWLTPKIRFIGSQFQNVPAEK